MPPQEGAPGQIFFQVSPDRYRHWRVSYDGPVATLVMDVDEHGGLVPGYELKPNSYDLGVDIELYDAVQRLRFEHPDVRTVVMTSGKPKIFCSLKRRSHSAYAVGTARVAASSVMATMPFKFSTMGDADSPVDINRKIEKEDHAQSRICRPPSGVALISLPSLPTTSRPF